MAGRGGDPAFESLLRSTQALAQNIRQAHEQQQGAYMMDAGSRNASVDSVLRNASIDSDLAYDGIEEVRLQT